MQQTAQSSHQLPVSTQSTQSTQPDPTNRFQKLVLRALALLTAGALGLSASHLRAEPDADRPCIGTQFSITGFQVVGTTALSPEEVGRITHPFTGPQRCMQDITGAAEFIRSALDAMGYPLARIYVPPQTSADGRIEIRADLSRIRSVTVRDNLHHSTDNIRRALPGLQEGAAPNTHDLLRDIASANEQPSRFVSVNFQASAQSGNVESGDVDASIRVRDENPFRVSMAIDNSGYGMTGRNRIQTGLRHSNLFNRDHVLNVQLGTFDRYDTGYVAAATYRIPLYGQGRWLEAQAVSSNVNTVFNPGTGDTRFNGKGSLYGIRLLQNLTPRADWQYRASAGLDVKDYRNVCAGSITDDCGSIAATPLTLGWSAIWNPNLQKLSLQLGYSHNLPGGQRSSEQAHDALGAQRHWSVWRGAAQYQKTWPGDIQAQISVSGQYTRDRLIPAEQGGIGGATTVRGYAERSLTGSRTWVSNLELYSPRVGPQWDERLELRALAFFDAGRNSTAPHGNAGDTVQTLTSAGIGVRGQWARNVVVQADWAIALKPLRNAPIQESQRERGDSFVHFVIAVFY